MGYFLIDLAASEQAQEMVGVSFEDRVECGQCCIEISEDVFESGLGTGDVENHGVCFVGLAAETEAVLIGIETLLEAVTVEESCGMN